MEIASYVYTVLARQLKAARARVHRQPEQAHENQHKTARADLFCEGWCNGVYHKISVLVPSEQENQLVAQYTSRSITRT